jgi:hypothetical protein
MNLKTKRRWRTIIKKAGSKNKISYQIKTGSTQEEIVESPAVSLKLLNDDVVDTKFHSLFPNLRPSGKTFCPFTSTTSTI